jgi:hypothetical protein
MLLLLYPSIAAKETTSLRIMQLPVITAYPAKFVLTVRVATSHMVAPFVFLNRARALQSK